MARTAHAAVIGKQTRAIALYAEGSSFDEIADELGYANRGSAWKAVDRGLRAERDLRAGDYLQTQIGRYERILATWWDSATTSHDAKAANIVLRALERLDKLLCLTEGDHTASPETLVVSANPEEYVKQLREIVSEREDQARVGRYGTTAQH